MQKGCIAAAKETMFLSAAVAVAFKENKLKVLNTKMTNLSCCKENCLHKSFCLIVSNK